MTSWIDDEIAGCEFKDERLAKRFKKIITQLSKGIWKTIPLACQDWASLREQLRKLRLPIASLELESVLSRRKAKADFNWLSELLEIELDARKENAIPRDAIEKLAMCDVVEANEIALMLGSPGTGIRPSKYVGRKPSIT